MMNSAVRQVLDDYERRSREEEGRWHRLERDQFMKERDQFLLAVGPATGELINLLVKEMKARSIVEIGTSYGYSTVWLAEAASATDGKVITLELHEGKQRYARQEIERAGLGSFVEFRLGDARESLAALDSGVDFVLLDLWKDLYIPCFDLISSRLHPGAIVVADNMLFPESARSNAAAYRKHVRSSSDFHSLLLPVGSGIEVSRCVRGLEAVAV